MRRVNLASRDSEGRVAFYVLLWKRGGLGQELFDDYWSNVHGPVCARLPGQYQYWQHHVSHGQGLWPVAPGVVTDTAPEEQFAGIAELTFRSERERREWFTAAAILMDDEHNLLSKAIGYNTAPGNSVTYVDGIADGAPNGAVGGLKLHVLVQKAEGASVEQFRRYLTERFAPGVAEDERVLKLRLHLLEAVDNSRPDAAGVSHSEPPEKQYQAAFEIAFGNRLEMEEFFASAAYARAVEGQARYIKRLSVFQERTSHAFVYGGRMTLAGQRGSKVAQLITDTGARNQLSEQVVTLMLSGRLPGQEVRP